MHCPFCRHVDSRVVDSRTADDGSTIRRRRQCPTCQRRFSTTETAMLTVTKRSGVSEPFSRAKIVTGVRKACQGRPVSDDDLALLAQQVEEHMRSSGQAQVEAHDVGLAILAPLRALDEIAYLRFASVYQAFDTLEDFEEAIALLRVERDLAAVPAGGSEDSESSADRVAPGEPSTSGESGGGPHRAGGPKTSNRDTSHLTSVREEARHD